MICFGFDCFSLDASGEGNPSSPPLPAAPSVGCFCVVFSHSFFLHGVLLFFGVDFFSLDLDCSLVDFFYAMIYDL